MNDLIEAPASDVAIPWTAAFAADIAIAKQGYLKICAEHGVSTTEWQTLQKDVEFTGSVEAIRLALRKDGGSFKIKARALAESLLPHWENVIYSDETPATVKADLMKGIVKIAGLDASTDQKAQTGGTPLSININLR